MKDAVVQRLHVSAYGPRAWQWVPESMETEREVNATGCRCKGTGSLGMVENFDPETGLKVSYAIPCVCLYAVIRPEKRDVVMRQVNNHFTNNRANGHFCGCLFCDQRRRIMPAADGGASEPHKILEAAQ